MRNNYIILSKNIFCSIHSNIDVVNKVKKLDTNVSTTTKTTGYLYGKKLLEKCKGNYERLKENKLQKKNMIEKKFILCF